MSVLQEEYIYVFAWCFIIENADYAMRYAHDDTQLYFMKVKQKHIIFGCGMISFSLPDALWKYIFVVQR